MDLRNKLKQTTEKLEEVTKTDMEKSFTAEIRALHSAVSSQAIQIDQVMRQNASLKDQLWKVTQEQKKIVQCPRSSGKETNSDTLNSQQFSDQRLLGKEPIPPFQTSPSILHEHSVLPAQPCSCPSVWGSCGTLQAIAGFADLSPEEQAIFKEIYHGMMEGLIDTGLEPVKDQLQAAIIDIEPKVASRFGFVRSVLDIVFADCSFTKVAQKRELRKPNSV